jgi:hypothetical protein
MATGFCAQGQPTTRLVVRLTDPSGATIENGHVTFRANTLKSPAVDIPASAGEKSGDYTIQVASGIYDILISAPCLAPFAEQLKVTSDSPRLVRVQLKMQSQVESSYVSEGCPTPDDFGAAVPLLDPIPVPAPEQIPHK